MFGHSPDSSGGASEGTVDVVGLRTAVQGVPTVPPETSPARPLAPHRREVATTVPRRARPEDTGDVTLSPVRH
eukprot:9087110-Prorocentrum_lima.AAC.1